MAHVQDSWRSGGTGTGAYIFQPRATDEVPLVARGVSGQTANLIEAQDSNQATVFSVDNTGNITFSGSGSIIVNQTVTGNLTVNGNTTLGNQATDTLTVSATPTFATSVTFQDTISADSSAVFGGYVSMPYLNLPVRQSTPGTIASVGRLYTKDVGSNVVELYYLDSTGAEIQFTSGGSLAAQELTFPATGPAVTGANYSISRDDGNVLHFNVPTGAAFEFSINDAAAISANVAAMALNIGLVVNTKTDNTATINVAAGDYYIGSQYSATGTVTVNLPPVANVNDGYILSIKDEGYNAATNNITLDPSGAELINNAATYVMNTDGESATILMSNGAWHLI